MTHLEAWASSGMGQHSKDELHAWFVSCRLMSAELRRRADEAGHVVREFGYVFDPAVGTAEHTYEGTHVPDQLSLGSRMQFHLSTQIWPAATNASSSPVGGVRVSASVWEEGHLDLVCTIHGPDLDDAIISLLLRDVLLRHGERFAVDFGNVAPDNVAGRSGLERSLRRRIDLSQEAAHEALRGYAWATVLPASLSAVVRQGLEGNPHLHLQDLATGTLYVQAGQDYTHYSDSTMAELFEVFAPVLPGGKPRVQRPLSGLPPMHVVDRDAREVAPFHLYQGRRGT